MNAIHALSSRFARDGTDRRIETELHVGKVMSRLVMHTGEPTTDIVCAMQITTMCVRGYRGFVPHDTLMCAVANFVLQLGWHRLDDDKDAPPPKTWDEWVDLETKRRAFWMNFQMDSYHVGRSGGAAIFDAEAVRTRMPCPESEWDDLSSWINRAHAHSVFANMNGRDSDSEDGGNSGVSTREALRYRCWTDPASIPAAGSSEESARIVTEQATPSARFDAMQETMLQSFWHRTPHCNLVKKIGKFISGARSSSVNSGSDCKPPRRPRLLSDDPMFSEYSQQLDYMCTLPPAAANLKDPLFNASKASFFGNIEHKKYLLRVRYFSQQLYTFPAVIMLHSSNRPSLFTETDTGLSSVLLDEEEIKISMALQKALGPAWSQGLVAKDIEPRSWRVCVDAAHRLSDVLRLNDDISLRRVDTVAPFCIFSTITVLLRQLRKCKHAMDSNDMSEMPIEEWKNEHTRSLAGIARQWRALQEMGSVWHIGGLAELLKPMHIDEVAKAAEQLSSMSLK
ncbi:hypothetical protein GQ54DRAFT_259672 [Martensiomyces pterosporus]|nr:hypothetical protein GQ54DRAFT_259672 [Martensiomyces pterosporus]